MEISGHTSALLGNIHFLSSHVVITPDVTIARPFIFLSWSYFWVNKHNLFLPSFIFIVLLSFFPRLQLMHLFGSFLSFFKDTHRGHSCRSNHQSPPALLLLPSTSFFFLNSPLPSPLWVLCLSLCIDSLFVFSVCFPFIFYISLLLEK